LSSTEPSSGRVWLIRHAQASFGTANYDALSTRGHEQAARLAAWLVSHPELSFAHICRGSLQRHCETLAAICAAFGKANRTLPDVHEDPDWNEFDHDAIVRTYTGWGRPARLVEVIRQVPSLCQRPVPYNIAADRVETVWRRRGDSRFSVPADGDQDDLITWKLDTKAWQSDA